MQRIVIVGEPGSGKSTLARLLAEQVGVKLVHLDQVYWQPGWTPPQFEQFKANHDRHVLQDHWVIEGLYTRTWDLRFERADTVVWLDLPLPLRLYRITRRMLTHLGKVRADAAPGCPERFDLGFYHYIVQGHKTRHEQVRQKVQTLRPDQQLVVLRSVREVEQFIQSFSVPGQWARSSKQP